MYDFMFDRLKFSFFLMFAFARHNFEKIPYLASPWP